MVLHRKPSVVLSWCELNTVHSSASQVKTYKPFSFDFYNIRHFRMTCSGSNITANKGGRIEFVGYADPITQLAPFSAIEIQTKKSEYNLI
jgi:hypothetical protein